MRRMVGDETLSIASTGPIHLYLENAVELALRPTQAGLEVHALYHRHPWISHVDGDISTLFQGSVEWSLLLDASLSAHERITQISRYAKAGEAPIGPAAHIDMTECDRLLIDIGCTQLSVIRFAGLGLSLVAPAKGGSSQDRKPKLVSRDLLPGSVSSAICAFAADADRRLFELSTWRRIWLTAATEYAITLHLLEDLIFRGASAARRHLTRKASST